MPLYEGSCGCYNWNEAKQFGVTAAILLNWFKNSYRHYKNKGELVDGMFWHDQKDIADEIAFGLKMLYNAIEVLENAGIIQKKVGYRPGTNKKTTWWGFVEDQVPLEVSESAQTALSVSAETEVSILKETKENDTNDGTDRIKPAQLYSRVHSFFGGRHDRRKAMIESIEKLQEDLSDETILLGCQEIAAHPTFRTKDGEEVTWTLSMLLLRDRDGLSKTADIILKAADKREAREKKAEKKKKVQYSTEECY